MEKLFPRSWIKLQIVGNEEQDGRSVKTLKHSLFNASSADDTCTVPVNLVDHVTICIESVCPNLEPMLPVAAKDSVAVFNRF